MGARVGFGFKFFGLLLRPFGLCLVLAFGFGLAVVVVVNTSSISNSTSPATVVIIAVVAAPGGPLGLQVYRTLITTSYPRLCTYNIAFNVCNLSDLKDVLNITIVGDLDFVLFNTYDPVSATYRYRK